KMRNAYKDYAITCNSVDRTKSSFEDCIQDLIIEDYNGYLSQYSGELCGRIPHRIFAYTVKHDKDLLGTRMSCYVECIDKYRLADDDYEETNEVIIPIPYAPSREPAMMIRDF
ncbi:MAG: hypothetical protein KC478_13045, partial [Bacteriovoracaceae bacterium]|nr:hypothetical protein [Bacteriovoracaceae bacterium]